MWDAGNNRSLQPVTVAILDFLVSHPYASKALIKQKLGFTAQQVQSTYYHYGFTGSEAAKRKYPDLWALGEKVRKQWPDKKPTQTSLPLKTPKADKPAKWVPKKKGPLPPPEQAKALTGWVEAIAKNQVEPTKGQEIVREVIKTDSEEIARLRSEINTLRIEKAYLERKLGLRNGNAV
jgi:hypothetical protein